MLRRSIHARRASWLLCTALVVAVSACAEDDVLPTVEGVIDRETFIAAYVDLRVETMAGSELNLTDEQRDEVLAQHGVDAAGLEAFVEAYGRELDFMNGVWIDVEARLEAVPTPAPDAGVSVR